MGYDPQDTPKVRRPSQTGNLFGTGPMDPYPKPPPAAPAPLSSGTTPATASASADAARDTSHRLGSDCAKVLEYIKAKGTATTDEVEAGLSMVHQTASSRIYDLAGRNRRRPDLLAIVETGLRRKTRTGSSATAYRAYHPDEIKDARRRLAERNATTGDLIELPKDPQVRIEKGAAVMLDTAQGAVEPCAPRPAAEFSRLSREWMERAGLFELIRHRDQVDSRIQSLEEGGEASPRNESWTKLEASWPNLIAFLEGASGETELRAARAAVALLLGGHLTPPTQGADHGQRS